MEPGAFCMTKVGMAISISQKCTSYPICKRGKQGQNSVGFYPSKKIVVFI